MDVDDLPGEAEAGVAAAAVAALLLSPRLRGLVRRGSVIALAGLLTAGDALTKRVRHTESEGQQGDAVDATFVRQLAREARGELANRGHQAGGTGTA
ncbi:MAG TPA: hypothetical protein VF510_20405 [Ktedonobacterales bacterium]